VNDRRDGQTGAIDQRFSVRDSDAIGFHSTGVLALKKNLGQPFFGTRVSPG
jgi:hypothetical protein